MYLQRLNGAKPGNDMNEGHVSKLLIEITRRIREVSDPEQIILFEEGL